MRFLVYGETSEQFEASISEKIKTFPPIFDEDRMKTLWRSLCEGQFIDKGTLEEHFLFFFGIIKDMPKYLRPINWIRCKNQLAYFVMQYCRAIRQEGDFRHKWVMAKSVFTIKGESLDSSERYLKTFIWRLENGEVKRPKKLDEIDKLLKR